MLLLWFYSQNFFNIAILYNLSYSQRRQTMIYGSKIKFFVFSVSTLVFVMVNAVAWADLDKGRLAPVNPEYLKYIEKEQEALSSVPGYKGSEGEVYGAYHFG